MYPKLRVLLEHLGVLGAYALLTVLLTYPLTFRLSTHLPGDGGDTNIFVWNLWWIKKALTELRTNPFWTDYLFYPEGVSLIFHVLAPFRGLLGIPLQAFLGLVAANNLILLVSFTLSGYGTSLLIRYLGAHRHAAFIGGIIFAFCPYKFAHLLGHFDLMSTEWLPFYALALVKLTNSCEQNRIGPPLRCAGLLLLIALSSHYYLFYALIFTGLFAAYRMRTRGFQAFWKRDRRRLATALGLFLIGYGPVLVLAWIELQGWRLEITHGRGGATGFQADLLAFITPSPLHTLLGPLVEPINARFKGGIAEATVFVGYLPLGLALVAIATLRRSEPWVRFWSLSLLAFFLLSLGPFPRILGHHVKPILLPYQLIMRAPILNNFRVPSRFDIMVMLCIAVLAAFSCDRLLKRVEGGVRRALVFLGIALTVAFEFLAIPFPTFSPSVPTIYERIASEPGPFTVLQVPLGWRDGIRQIGTFSPSFLSYQTVHENKIVGGYISRVPDAKIQALAARPLLRKILELQGTNLPPDIIHDQPGGTPIDDLAALQVRYIIIHAPFSRAPVRDYVEGTLPVEKISEENGVVAFQVTSRGGKTR